MIIHKKKFKVLVFRVVFVLLGNIFAIHNCYPQQNGQVQIFYDSAWVYYNSGNYPVSLEYLQKTLNIKHQSVLDYPPEYVKVHNRLGMVYFDLGNLQKSIDSYVEALNNTQNEYYMSIINMNIANIYALKGNCSKAIDFYENSLTVLNRSEHKKKYAKISDVYHNIGFAYYVLGKYNLAKEYYLKSIRISQEYNTGDMGDTYRNCGLAYEKMDSLELAKEYFITAVRMNTKAYGENNPRTTNANLSLAGSYAKTKDYIKAEKLYNQIYKKLLFAVGLKHQLTAYYYNEIGDMYSSRNNYGKALACYQQSLIAKIPDFSDSSVYKNPPLKTLPDIDLIDILKNKALAFERFSDEENQQAYLAQSLKTLELMVYFIEQLRMGYLYEDSKLALAEKEHETYEAIIRVSYTLMNLTGDKSYADLAFKYSERSKYAVLRESVNEEAARGSASIPDSIVAKERNIQEQIGNTRLQIRTNGELVKPDEIKLALLKEKLFRLNQEKEKIVQDLEQNYPAYYKSKYDNRVIGIEGIRKAIQEKEALISYELTDSSLYTFLVTDDTVSFNRVPVDSNFYNHLKRYQEFLHSHSEPGYVQYRVAAYELYKTLIKPLRPWLKGKHLLIVPDSKMSLIAFEAFVTEPYQEKNFADYATEPYLLLDYPVGYAYSATLYMNSCDKQKSRNPKFLGFAPDYENSRDSLDNMPLAIKSLKGISRFVRGKIYTGEDATEYNLKRNLKNYGILHLYAHGNEDLENPWFSKIYLSYRNDTVEDGYLYAYEVDGLEIDADLVVLASCYSGSGAINKSEGALSIGRRFLNMGSPSMVISLWTATYEPTLSELKEFYKHLVLGKPKDEALRLAKLKYLKSANPLEANPRYWSGLVVIGDQEALFKGYVAKRFIFPLLIIIFLPFFIIKTMKKVKGKR